MNYIELIESIYNRPKFFLRDKNIYELGAFLRGVSYANFAQKNEKDMFRTFTDEWIPKTFKNRSHDWIETIVQHDEKNEPFLYFFILWEDFLKYYE